MSCKVKENEYKKYDNVIYAKRIIANKSSNDWNDEPEYKLQKVRIYGETKTGESYIVDSYGNFKFKVLKCQIFLNFEDMVNKIDNIKNFNLQEYEKEYLLKQYFEKEVDGKQMKLDELIKRLSLSYKDVSEVNADYCSVAIEDVDAIIEYLKQLRDISKNF